MLPGWAIFRPPSSGCQFSTTVVYLDSVLPELDIACSILPAGKADVAESGLGTLFKNGRRRSAGKWKMSTPARPGGFPWAHHGVEQGPEACGCKISVLKIKATQTKKRCIVRTDSLQKLKLWSAAISATSSGTKRRANQRFICGKMSRWRAINCIRCVLTARWGVATVASISAAVSRAKPLRRRQAPARHSDFNAQTPPASGPACSAANAIFAAAEMRTATACLVIILEVRMFQSKSPLPPAMSAIPHGQLVAAVRKAAAAHLVSPVQRLPQTGRAPAPPAALIITVAPPPTAAEATVPIPIRWASGRSGLTVYGATAT